MRRRAALWLCVAFLCAAQVRGQGSEVGGQGISLTPPTQHSTPASTPLSEYRRLLTDYQTATAKGLTPEEAKNLRPRFEAAKSVELPGGGRIAPDNSAEIAVLNATVKRGKPRKEAFVKARGTLLNDLNAPPNGARSPVARAVNDPKAQAKKILSAKEFAPAEQAPAQKNALAQALEWIDKQWKKLWGWLFGGGGKMKPVPWLAEFTLYVIYAILGVAALVGLFLLVRFLMTRHENREGRIASATGQGMDLLFDIADPLGEAKNSAAQGDYRAALRLAYIASLRRLAGTGYLVLQENRTNWECQNSLRRRSTDAFAALLPATRLFDAVWYGNRPATAAEYQAVIAAHDSLPVVPCQSPYQSETSDNKPNAVTPAASIIPTRPKKSGNSW